MFSLPFLKNLSFGNKNPNKFLCVDLGSDAVKALAFYFDEDEKRAKIIGYSRRPLEAGHIRSGTIVDIENVELALKEAVTEASQNSEEPIHNVIFGLSGNYNVNRLTTARLTKSDSSPVTEKEHEELRNRIVTSALDTAYSEISETTGASDIDLEMVTSAEVYTKVDDRYVKDLANATGQKIELGVFTSFVPTFHLKNINKLAKKCGLGILAIAPEMYSLIKALNYPKMHSTDCVLINMGSDKTDIGVVFGGNVITSKTLPIGGYHFTYQISQKMGLSLREAENLKRNYSTGKLTHNESVLIQECVTETLETWLSGIELLFNEFTGVKTFSQKILLGGGGIALPDAYDFISGEPWSKSIPFKSDLEFTKINVSDLQCISDSTKNVSGPDWVYTASLGYIFLEMKGITNDHH